MASKIWWTCDICDSSTSKEENVTTIDIEYPGGATRHYDLCRACSAKVSNYLRNLREDYNAKE